MSLIISFLSTSLMRDSAMNTDVYEGECQYVSITLTLLPNKKQDHSTRPGFLSDTPPTQRPSKIKSCFEQNDPRLMCGGSPFGSQQCLTASRGGSETYHYISR
jgi:hypothetical protein